MTILQPSRYAIYSDNLYTNAAGKRLRLVYGTRRAVPMALDEQTADQLRAGRVPTTDAALLQRLIDTEIVVPAATGEMDVLVERSRKAAQADGYRSFTLMPTSYCNMGCTYCGQQHTKGRLPADHRAAVAARVERAIKAPSTQEVKIRWFGGEPMMGYAVLLDLSSRFTATADQNGVRYSAMMVTNGSLLTLRKLHRLRNDGRITKLCITLDGPKEIHDRSRILKSGGTSFTRITSLVTEALADQDLADVSFELRTNVTKDNADHIDTYLHHMAETGLAHSRVTFTLEPVHAWSNDVSGIALNATTYAARESAWLTTMTDLGLNFTILPTASKPVVCAAVTKRSEIISSTGAIFSCSEQPLVPQAEQSQALARISDNTLADLRPSGPFDSWHDQLQNKEVPCSKCPMLGICGGSCPKLWSEGISPCPSYKHNFQHRLALLARKHQLTPVT
ncbi:radical SAM protein [Kitasatospora sp. NPDC001540]|uniref:radical SAM protein n=1 Tax=Kitasatospora sp. NPDC001540 TaxID=3364014 RepID=UPI0036BCC876